MMCDHCGDEIPIKRNNEYFEIIRRISEGGASKYPDNKIRVHWGVGGTLKYHNHCFAEIAGEEYRREMIEKSSHKYDKGQKLGGESPSPTRPIKLMGTPYIHTTFQLKCIKPLPPDHWQKICDELKEMDLRWKDCDYYLPVAPKKEEKK